LAWVKAREAAGFQFDKIMRVDARYESVLYVLDSFLVLADKKIIQIHKQVALPYPQHLAIQVIESWLSDVLDRGGEGLVLRDPNMTYKCERSHKLLKYKPFDDMEGTVIGYITGRETDKGSRLLGKMGAMILRLDSGVRLELSGFTDAERLLNDGADAAREWAIANPEKECPEWIWPTVFPRGSRVTFKYRGLSADGVPIEARYWRNRDD
jgi:DNA ligase-1